MKVYIKNIELIDKKLYPLDLFYTGDKLNIKSQIDPKKYYTIIIVDPDAPNRLNPINKYMIHLFLQNST